MGWTLQPRNSTFLYALRCTNQCLHRCFLSLIFVVSIKSYQVLALIPLIAKGYILPHFPWVFSSDIDGSTLCVLTSSSTKEWITVHYLKVPNVNSW